MIFPLNLISPAGIQLFIPFFQAFILFLLIMFLSSSISSFEILKTLQRFLSVSSLIFLSFFWTLLESRISLNSFEWFFMGGHVKDKLNFTRNYNHKSEKSQKKSDFFLFFENLYKKCTHFDELYGISTIK